jgi:hypothetical protein
MAKYSYEEEQRWLQLLFKEVHSSIEVADHSETDVEDQLEIQDESSESEQWLMRSQNKLQKMYTIGDWPLFVRNAFQWWNKFSNKFNYSNTLTRFGCGFIG